MAPTLRSAAHAEVFQVDSTRDDGPDFNPGNGVCEGQAGLFTRCTLRAAITEANALPGPDVIVVPAGTYNLDFVLGQHDLLDDVVIDGESARNTILVASSHHRIFNIDWGIEVTLRDLQLTGARVNDDTADANWGGAVRNLGDLAVEYLWINDNSATGGCGGLGSWGSAFVLDSTFSGNSAEEDGGGVCATNGGEVILINTTFAHNHAGLSGAATKLGGVSSSLTIRNSTFLDNWVGDPSGATDIAALRGELRTDLNLFTGTCSRELITHTSAGGNRQQDGASCLANASGDLGGLSRSSLGLGGLADNGGRVPTVLIAPHSAAIDITGHNSSYTLIDARGEPRVGPADAGALELQPEDPSLVFADGFEVVGTGYWSSTHP